MKFNAEINIIGVNPYVQVPDKILQNIFRKYGKNKGAIPIKGAVNGIPYKQTLIRYSGDWRLDTGMTMLNHFAETNLREGKDFRKSITRSPE